MRRSSSHSVESHGLHLLTAVQACFENARRILRAPGATVLYGKDAGRTGSGYLASVEKSPQPRLSEMEQNEYTISLLGDIMLGRLVDQLLPNHVEEPEEARHVARMKWGNSELQNYAASSPWGNTLNVLSRSSLSLGNLETSMTTSGEKWPGKVFNYRMHPANVECLLLAKIDYVSLANNHTLDFGREGLFDTVETLQKSGIAYAGAGRSLAEAERPATLTLPKSPDPAVKGLQEHEIHLYSFSDHPSDWVTVPQFNLIGYVPSDRARLKTLLTQKHAGLASTPSLKVVSLHWGPNYAWEPDKSITDLAHFLIDECDVDMIHGHSSHHVQGIEIYKGRPILYGCGDFVDDYAVVPRYRNDLGAIWNLTMTTKEGGGLEMRKIEVFPTRIKHFKAGLAPEGGQHHGFVCERVRTLSAKLGTTVEAGLGDEGQLIVDITRHR